MATDLLLLLITIISDKAEKLVKFSETL